MIRLRLSARDRRSLAVGACGILLAFGIPRLIPAYLSWQREARAEDVEVRTALARARTLIAHAPETHDSAVARGRRVIALAPSILSGDTPGAAGAVLAGLLSGAAAQSGVRLVSLQMRGDSISPDTFTRIGVQFDATGDIRGITHLLALLEQGPALIRVCTLSITQPEPSAADDRMEALHLELIAEGLMLNPVSPR